MTEERVYYEEIGALEQLGALYAALAAAQGEFLPVEKSGSVDFTGKTGRVSYRYAPIAEIRKATSGALAKHGLCFAFALGGDLGEFGQITGVLGHSGGASMRTTVVFTPRGDIKELGGQTTYLRRYIMQCMLGVEGEESTEESGESDTTTTKPRQERARRETRVPDQRPANDGPDPYMELGKSRKDAGFTDADVTKTCRALFGRPPGGCEPAEVLRLAKFIRLLDEHERTAIKGEMVVDAIVAEARDRINANITHGGRND